MMLFKVFSFEVSYQINTCFNAAQTVMFKHALFDKRSQNSVIGVRKTEVASVAFVIIATSEENSNHFTFFLSKVQHFLSPFVFSLTDKDRLPKSFLLVNKFFGVFEKLLIRHDDIPGTPQDNELVTVVRSPIYAGINLTSVLFEKLHRFGIVIAQGILELISRHVVIIDIHHFFSPFVFSLTDKDRLPKTFFLVNKFFRKFPCEWYRKCTSYE